MESRLHAFLNFWGLILGAAIGAAALIWTGSRARQTAEIDQVVSELKLQNERANQEIQRSRAEPERWKSEAEQLRRLEQHPTPSQPPEKPIGQPSLPETISPCSGQVKPDTQLSNMGYPLEVIGTDIPERRVQPRAIVEHLDVIDHIIPRFLTRGIVTQRRALPL
jgi:hypothetical protein